MTCIVGIADQGKVYIGGDSAGVNDSFQSSVRADTKVFLKDEFLYGYCGSFRMGQVLRFKFDAPARKENQDDYEYLISDWIDHLRQILKESGCVKEENGVEELPGSFLFGYRGNLYTVEADFQVGQPAEGIAACGCADDVALGSIYTSINLAANYKLPITSEAKVTVALVAAANFSGGVRPPFVVKTLDSNSSQTEEAKNERT